MSNILVVTESRDGQLKSVSFEALTAAGQLADGGSVTALVLGSHSDDAVAAAAKYGAGKIMIVENDGLDKGSPDVAAAAIANAAREVGADLILSVATLTGRDIMARAAFALDSALAQDCTAFRSEGGDIYWTRPVYAGKALVDVKVTGSPVMATLRPKAVKPEENPAAGEVQRVSPDLPAPKAVVASTEVSKSDRLSVTEADIIVSGGRGMQGPEHWNILEDLADALGGATGCSRPVSDEGWRPHGEHIGQTGVTVSPDLYIACGISGAIQHIAGMSSSKYIVAINKDPEAPIFKVADYGIVGDVFDVLPAMTEAVKAVKAND